MVRAAMVRAALVGAAVLALTLAAPMRPAQAQTAVSGYVSNTSTNAYGVQVYLNSGLAPSVCASTANQGGWMLVAAANKPMISVVLLAAALNTQVTLYADGSITAVGTARYCNVTQIVSALR